MKHPIFQVMGTHGSGKSTMVRAIMAMGDAQALFDDYSKSRPCAYKVTGVLRRPLYVLGPYHNACGGCDALNGPVNVIPRLERYQRLGPVLFEGAIISSYGAIGAWAEPLKQRHVYLFLDTPLAVCQKRVNTRRKQDGKEPLADTHNIDARWRAMRSLYKRLEGMGKNARWVNYRSAKEEVLDVMGEYVK